MRQLPSAVLGQPFCLSLWTPSSTMMTSLQGKKAPGASIRLWITFFFFSSATEERYPILLLIGMDRRTAAQERWHQTWSGALCHITAPGGRGRGTMYRTMPGEGSKRRRTYRVCSDRISTCLKMR